jgi:hypothetical protein
MFHPIVYILWYLAAFFSLVTAMSWISLDALESSLKQIHEKWYKVRSSSIMLFMALFFLYEGSGLAPSHVSPASLLNNSVLATILAPLLFIIFFFFFAIVSAIVLHTKLTR